MNTKIRCVLLDDELPGLTYLKMLCEQIDELEVVKAFNSPQVFLEEWKSLEFDLLISDIEMPGVNGLQVADAIQGKPIIFTTAYKDFAVDAFDKNAVDYVVKPVKKERLEQAVQKVTSLMRQAPVKVKQIPLNTDKGKALVPVNNIFCIIASDIDSRDKIIILGDGSRVIVKNYSFEKIGKQLPSHEFCRINKRTVIALKHVQYYMHDEITADIATPDGKQYVFTLSEIYKSEFLQKVNR